MVRCDSSDAMRCIWSDAIHLMRCGAYGPMLFLFVQKKISLITNRCDAVHVTRCDVVHYGPILFLFVQKKISLNTNRCDAVHVTRCGAYDPMRCGAYGPMRFI